MKTLWKIIIGLAAVILLYYVLFSLYHSWEISTRPNPVVAWWEYELTGLGSLLARFETAGMYMPDIYMGLFVKTTLWASNEDGTRKWKVGPSKGKPLSSNIVLSPSWAVILDGQLLISESDWSGPEKFGSDILSTIDLLSEKSMPFNLAYSDDGNLLPHPDNRQFSFSSPDVILGNSAFNATSLPVFTVDASANALPLFFNPKTLTTTYAPPERMEFLFGKGFEDFTFSGKDNILMASSQRYISSQSKWPNGALSARLGIYDLSGNISPSLYYICAKTENGVLYPVALQHESNMQFDERGFAKAKARLQCLAPPIAENDSLLLISLVPRTEENAKASNWIALLSPSHGITRFIGLPEEVQRLHAEPFSSPKIYRTWYIPEKSCYYVLFKLIDHSTNSTQDMHAIYELNQDYKWRLILKYNDGFWALPVWSSPSHLWYVECTNDKKGNVIGTKCIRMNVVTGEKNVIKETSRYNRIVSLHSSFNP